LRRDGDFSWAESAFVALATIELGFPLSRLRAFADVLGKCVVNPLSFYLDTLDTSAFEKAESGGAIGQYDAPFLPLIAPWLIAGPVLALAPLSSKGQLVVFVTSLVISFTLWVSAALFYYRRVQKYRRNVSVPADG